MLLIVAVTMMSLGTPKVPDASARCVKTRRGEPTVMITDNKRRHYVYLLKGEEKLCEAYVVAFNNGTMENVCGCKHLIYWKGKTEYNTVGLRCAYTYNNKILSSRRRIAQYFYYPEMVSACKKLARTLMKKGL